MIRAYDSTAIREAEAPLLAAGVPLMREAARALATRALAVLSDDGATIPGSVALALVGGGNNGGDALYAAADLARRGLTVYAALCSAAVHEEGLAAARAAGVRSAQIVSADRSTDTDRLLELARRSGIWLDGLAGIGLAGPLREPLAGIVEALGQEKDSSPDEPVVIAIDVPSGVGDDGAVRGPLLRADITVTMGAAKPGLLLPPAAEYAGDLEVVELGLPLAEAEHRVERLSAADVADLYPWPRRSDHKYTRGVVGIWAGSERYPGAAALAVDGALAAGPGMVRYLGSAPGLTTIH
ncbi:MAG TPA: dehydrogenase, partial [Actinomycetales bacterium]|nr:dehydrogenase [Actinomycetales bacterium]